MFIREAVMDRVLVAVDGSEASDRSLDTLINLVKSLRTAPEVVVLAIQTPMPPLAGMGVVVGTEVLDAEIAQACDAVLHTATRKLQESGLGCTERKDLGDPSDIIVHVAEEIGAKLIFMGSRGLGALGTLVMGSTSNQVLRHTHIPVVLTH
jgi:nucleotide-binding universal stress UspA family protein